jgi:hypothetical protein
VVSSKGVQNRTPQEESTRRTLFFAAAGGSSSRTAAQKTSKYNKSNMSTDPFTGRDSPALDEDAVPLAMQCADDDDSYDLIADVSDGEESSSSSSSSNNNFSNAGLLVVPFAAASSCGAENGAGRACGTMSCPDSGVARLRPTAPAAIKGVVVPRENDVLMGKGGA